ncbi:MAG: ACP S-malonyltransferase [Pseudomonadota bacterium]
MGHAFVFPGQGSQSVGMGKGLADAFPAAREVFEEVDDALERALTKIMWTGDMETLSLTANTQPALMAHSVAMMRVLEKDAGADIGAATFVAGHSLGEYSALCAAGALPLAETARLLQKRGEETQAAVPPGEGAMAALIGVDLEGAEAAIAATPGEGVLEIANDNAPGQVVVSGAKARIDALVADAKSHKIKMAKVLPVSAAFHCSMMAPAADAMAGPIGDAPLTPPKSPVVANVTARETSHPDDIRKRLVEQITGRVRWTESVLYMGEQGVDTFYEVGSGKVLSGLMRRISKEATTASFGEPDDVDAFAKAL